MLRRAEQSDGLLDFLFHQSRSDLAVPVELVSSVSGTVETAHVRRYGREVFVTGLVGRGVLQPNAGSHIDVEVFNPAGNLSQAHVTGYLPAPISSGRFGHSLSRYCVRLPSVPAPGSSVRVTFHNVPRAMCAFAADPGKQASAARHPVGLRPQAIADASGVH